MDVAFYYFLIPLVVILVFVVIFGGGRRGNTFNIFIAAAFTIPIMFYMVQNGGNLPFGLFNMNGSILPASDNITLNVTNNTHIETVVPIIPINISNKEGILSDSKTDYGDLDTGDLLE